MDRTILMAIAASFCTATASLCQRKGAESADGGLRLQTAAAARRGPAGTIIPRIGQLADVHRTARRE
jgi:hypothetical protein